MPPRKTSTTKRTVVRKTTVPRSVRQKVFSMKRTAYSGYLQSQPTTGVLLGSQAFTLNSLPSFNEFTNLFDQYRILKCEVMCYPRQSAAPVAGQNASLFHWAPDHTDVTAPANEADVLQYEGRRTVQAYKPFKMTLSPKPAAAYWQGLTATGYGPVNRQWIDTKSPAVQHYGIKYIWTNNVSPAVYIDTFTTYWVEFREPQ